jgi:hypothetical protein
MRVLHLLRTEPGITVERFIECFSDEKESAVETLYQGDVDWSRLVDDIFSYDKVICWW